MDSQKKDTNMINLFRISRDNFDIHNAHLQGKVHIKVKIYLIYGKVPTPCSGYVNFPCQHHNIQ